MPEHPRGRAQVDQIDRAAGQIGQVAVFPGCPLDTATEGMQTQVILEAARCAASAARQVLTEASFQTQAWMT